MTPAEIHRGAHSKYMHEAQEYSYQWGRMMHLILRGDPTITTFESGEATRRDGLAQYMDWLRGDGIDATMGSLDQAPPEVRAHGLNELNFHILNRYMSDMSIPMAGGSWKSDTERYEIINQAQDNLAITALQHYMQREDLIAAAQGTELLFDKTRDPDLVMEHATITGIFQEYDAAIILLDLARKNKHVSVVPAPLQFERTRKRTNVDFIVTDFVEQRSVGVQVKSRLRSEDVAMADPDRVVFLDGDTDLGNVRVQRVQRGRSTEQLRPWPGIIGVKHIDLIKGHGQRGRHLARHGKLVPILKQAARKLTGHLKVDRSEVVRTVGDRIFSKLYE